MLCDIQDLSLYFPLRVGVEESGGERELVAGNCKVFKDPAVVLHIEIRATKEVRNFDLKFAEVGADEG